MKNNLITITVIILGINHSFAQKFNAIQIPFTQNVNEAHCHLEASIVVLDSVIFKPIIFHVNCLETYDVLNEIPEKTVETKQTQTIIGSVFDEKFADSLILDKINQVRFDKGLSIVYPSNKLRTYISQKQSSTMVKENRLFHPGNPENLDFYRQIATLGKEFSKINDKYELVYNSDSVPSYSIDEIAVKINSQPSTYEELAERCVKAWLNSPPHKGIMLSSGYNGYLHKYFNLLCGVSIKKTGNVYYGCVNYIEF
jgi:uncharacterized protein YkwD